MPFGEIVANPSDLKHVGELMGRSNGLGVVITFGLHHLCVFYKRFPNGPEWYETEVGILRPLYFSQALDEIT